jgi:putative tricarboxylic transport membrane protein
MLGFIKNPKDFFAGAVFIAISAVFAYGVLELPVGTAFRMGPGYFPMVLAGLLAVLGFVIMLNGIRGGGESFGTVAWRGLILIILPLIFFGATLKGLGLVPSLAITVFVTTLASHYFNFWVASLNTAVLVISGWLIFIKGLGLPISIFGPWVGGY